MTLNLKFENLLILQISIFQIIFFNFLNFKIKLINNLKFLINL